MAGCFSSCLNLSFDASLADAGTWGKREREQAPKTQGQRRMLSLKKVRDPVCGMEKPKGEFRFSRRYQGKTYFFCSQQCQRMFEAHPRGYTGEQGGEENEA